MFIQNLNVMKKFLFVFLLLSFTWKFNSQIAFGDGSNGSFTNTISDNVVNQYKRIQSVSSTTFTILNTTDFSCSNGNVVLVINMLSGEYELRQVESVSGSNVTLSAGSIANSNFSSNSQMIKVPQYSNLTINAGSSITCPAWDGETGGVICFLVSNTLNLNNGQIDAAGKGFYNGLGGAGGVGGAGGLGGFSGTNLSSNGGQSGYGGSGIGGAGWGGDLGFSPALATAGTTSYFNLLANNLPCGNLVPSCNNSPNPSGRLYMGDGSFGGDGGQGKYGAGGGGSNCNQPGIDGGNGGNGGIGGDGGKGGGIIFINAGNIVHANTSINVSGTGGTNGLAGTNGGNGGDGTCGGGGGNGADGGNGGGGGHGGAGGAVKIVKSGGLVLSNLVNVQGGPGSNGGAGGAGGFGGVNSTNTSGLCACGTGYSCSFPMLIPYLDDVNTTVSVDGFGNTHFIYIYGDSILDLVYFDATFCNGYYMGFLQGQLIEAGNVIETYLAPIASLSDNILASLIDFVDNNTPNLDSSGNSILTANYHLIDGCVCSNCGPSISILAEDGDPGNNGPQGSSGGDGYYDEECAPPVISSTSSGYVIMCPGMCTDILFNVSDPNAIINILGGNGFVNGNMVTICPWDCWSQNVQVIATNQCGSSAPANVFVQVYFQSLLISPYSQTICSGSAANVLINYNYCSFSNSINYNMDLTPGVTSSSPEYGYIWNNWNNWNNTFNPIFYNSTNTTQVVNITFYSNCWGSSIQIIVQPSTTSNEVVSSCNSYTWNGQTYTQSGTYTGTTVNCITESLNLTITPSSTNTTTALSCDSYVWNGTTYTTSGVYTGTTANCITESLNLTITPSSTNTTTASACNSYLWNGTTYTTSGVYQYEGISVNGCDSIITLNLTISNDFTSNEVVSSCNSYSWNGVNYTESGVYQYDGVSMSGCDSVATLNLIINLPPNPPSVNVSTNLNGEITCSTPFLNNVTYQWLTCPNYIVIPGANSSNYNPMDNGNYAVVVSNSCGSDTSQCLSENSILDTYETEEIMLYPNPSSGQIIIEAKGIANENFTIYSAEGRKLQVGTLKNGLSVLDIQSFANGSYIFQIAGKQIRFVIQK